MLQIIGAFVLIGVLHLHGLLKSQLKTIIVFVFIWTSGLAIALMVAQGIFLPVVGMLNQAYDVVHSIFSFE